MLVNLLWAVGSIIASYVIAAVFTEQPAPPKPTALEDFDLPQVEDGTPQAVVFGDVICDGWQILWYGNYRTSEVTAGSASK